MNRILPFLNQFNDVVELDSNNVDVIYIGALEVAICALSRNPAATSRLLTDLCRAYCEEDRSLHAATTTD